MLKFESLEMIGQKVHHVLEVRHLTSSVFVLRLARNGLSFQPGQRLILGIENNPLSRYYSIYSGNNEGYIEVLIREVDNGALSGKFKLLEPGENVIVEGPFGDFILPDEIRDKKFLFIATGTGIAPYHCMVKSHPELNYTLLHGIKQCHEMFEKNDYASSMYIPCITGETCNSHKGRVTHYIEQNQLDEYKAAYLCGNSHMIYNANLLLKKKGFSWGNIFVEVYF
jgi:ferredoxin/flavodoxin---NADP+ reductase